jgi:hypothetical protein
MPDKLGVFLVSPHWREKLAAQLDVELEEAVDGIQNEQCAEINQDGND